MSDTFMALFFRLQTTWRQSSLQSRRTVGGVLGVGLILIAGVLGSWAGATFALIVIVAAVATTLFVRAVDGLRNQLANMHKQLHGINDRISRFAVVTADSEEPQTAVVDLASMGPGDPASLIAATLDRSVFPRLATTMDIAPPATGTTAPDPSSVAGASSLDPLYRPIPSTAPSEGVAAKNLMRQWKLGLRTGDLLACREVYSALVDTADRATIEPMRLQLEALTERIAAIHRATFRRHAASRDLAAMLETGRQICQLLPDHPLATEVRALEPSIRQHLNASQARAPSALRVVT